MRKLLFAVTALVGLSSAAHASIIPVLDTITLVGTEYEFRYSGTVAGDAGFVAGNRLVIFDFGGYVDGSISAGIYASDMDAFVELTSPVIPPPGVTDDPGIVNLVFEWSGAPFNASGGPFQDVDFAGLTARSSTAETRVGAYSATTTINNGGATGGTAFNSGPVVVPVPEPSTVALVVLGLGLAATARRRPALPRL